MEKFHKLYCNALNGNTMKMTILWCVYDKDHMSALRLKNTSESDPRSYIAKPRNNSEAPTGFKSFYNEQVQFVCFAWSSGWGSF